MCEPTTIMLAAAAVGAGSQIAQGQNAAAQGKNQQSLANLQADQVQASAAYDAQAIRKNAEAGRGAAVAGMAGSGVQIGEGSALEVERKILTTGEEDAMMTLLNADRQARSIRAQGRMARNSGQDAAKAGWISGGTTLLGGAAKYNMWGGAPVGG